VLAITYPDFVTAQAAMEIARQINPGVRIIARATAAGEIGSLDAHGAEEIVQPEFEAGLEFVRQTMIWCDSPLEMAMSVVEERRAAYYRIPGSPLVPPERATETV
jgi:CPA2 family monovalent cation:H+ antiporter-2